MSQTLTLEYLLNALIADGHISAQQAQPLRSRELLYRKQGIHPLISVADMQWSTAQTPHYKLNLERLTRWLAKHSSLPYLHIDPLRTDFSKLTELVSHAYAERFNILPVSATQDSVTIATSDPLETEWLGELNKVLNRDIQRVIANPQDIAHYLREFYGLRRSLQNADGDKRIGAKTSNLHNFEQLLELGSKREGEPDAGDQHIIHIVDWLLQYAFEQRASDIHLEPRREQGHVRFRIDGKLNPVHEIPTPIMLAMISRLKMLGRMNLAERRRPQDGRIKTLSPETGREVELRLSSMPTTFGEKLVMRIFDPEVLVKDFSALGFSKRDIKTWDSMSSQPHGIILVTGPTGSGKTSTLYSALRHLAKPEINICTIEDPIEVVDDQFNQMQVNPAINVDFATGVRTLLRQDPDIIMVGEIRDRATADVSIQAALTGHLVLSTLHTNDAPSAITRLLDIGVPAYLIRATLLGAVAQRLVRTLCPHCKTTAPTNPDLWKALVAPFQAKMPEQVGVPVGCDVCRHTGFYGRIGLYEMMTIGPELEPLISPDVGLGELRRAALKEGLCPLRLSGAQKVAARLTTFEEIFNVVGLSEKL